MHNLLGNKRLVTTLLYSAIYDEGDSKTFHSKCDNKGPTICLFKIDGGHCVGGYTEA
jgi:hypothetical protein